MKAKRNEWARSFQRGKPDFTYRPAFLPQVRVTAESVRALAFPKRGLQTSSKVPGKRLRRELQWQPAFAPFLRLGAAQSPKIARPGLAARQRGGRLQIRARYKGRPRAPRRPLVVCAPVVALLDSLLSSWITAVRIVSVRRDSLPSWPALVRGCTVPLFQCLCLPSRTSRCPASLLPMDVNLNRRNVRTVTRTALNVPVITLTLSATFSVLCRVVLHSAWFSPLTACCFRAAV